MKYISVCSGVESASLAWSGLGWEPVFFSEIEKFPSEVLKVRYPNVPNLGDMQKIRIRKDSDGTIICCGENGEVRTDKIDLLVGGTPCQDLSTAGYRAGLDGERSSLAYDFVRLAYESGAKWFVWENVPGVFSSNQGRDFARLLSLFTGLDIDTPDKRWDSSGFIVPKRRDRFAVSWRVLDSQFTRTPRFPYAIPQRRKRVFIVGCLGDWESATSVLLEPKSESWITPTRRKIRQGDTGNSQNGLGESGKVTLSYDSYNTSLTEELAHTITHGCTYALGTGARVLQYVFIKTSRARNSHDCETYIEGGGKVCNTINTMYPEPRPCELIVEDINVRRLMPLECERLMGFPDNWTRIPWRGKPEEECPESHRYKVCGNSMCVNVMEWIGQRIDEVEKQDEERRD